MFKKTLLAAILVAPLASAVASDGDKKINPVFPHIAGTIMHLEEAREVLLKELSEALSKAPKDNLGTEDVLKAATGVAHMTDAVSTLYGVEHMHQEAAKVSKAQ